MACERFLQAKLLFSYRMTVRLHCDTPMPDVAPNASETRELCKKSDRTNVMAKEGNLEIRLSDLTLALIATALTCTVVCGAKTMLYRKRRM